VCVIDEAGPRIVEPYLIFESAEGDMVLHGWLRSGEFRHSSPPHWCNLHLDDVLAAEVLWEEFDHPHPDYNPHSPLFHRVVFEINGQGPRHAGAHDERQSRLPPNARRAPPRRKSSQRADDTRRRRR
jgi:hypothetical protein